MAGTLQLMYPKATSSSVKEQAARTVLRSVRSKGHVYVELREEGRRFIYFCTLCLSPCYGETALFQHLNGNFHTRRLSAAQITLLGPNPWPFSDGITFFHNSIEDQLAVSNENHNRFLEHQTSDSNLAIVTYGKNLNKCNVGMQVELDETPSNILSYSEGNSDDNVVNHTVVIPRVLIRNEVFDIEVMELGLGKISARFIESNGVSNGIGRIWCEWLGKMDLGDLDKFKVPKHDFAVVNFTYNVQLSRKWVLSDGNLLLLSSPQANQSESAQFSRKRKKSSCENEGISDSLSYSRYDLSPGGSSTSNNSTSGLLLDPYDSELLQTKFISNKEARRELRKQQRLAAERMCGVCQLKMLPGKDVATLLNMKDGRLACSGRNRSGAFHIFHTSCLIHWILLCEKEMITKESVGPKVRRRSMRKKGSYKVGKYGEMKGIETEIDSVFCPECHGTGTWIDGEDLETRSRVSLSEIFKYKLKVSDGRRAWMQSPEVLENCSIGFHFPYEPQETIKEVVKPLKLLRFYTARDLN